MRIRFALAASVVALAVAACSSVVSGKGSPGSDLASVPTVPNVPTSAEPPTPAPSVSFPPSSSSVPLPSPSITFAPPTPPVISSALPSISSPPPTDQTDFKCPYIVFPATHLSFVCVADKMTKTTQADPWPVAWRKVVAHYGDGSSWSLDTGAGHWGKQGSSSLRDIAVQVRNQMVALGDYGKPGPSVQTAGKQIEVSGHKAYQLVTTFTMNPKFRQQSDLPIKHEKSWIVAVEVAPDDVSLWYVSVPDVVSYYWRSIGALISTISVS